MSMRGDDADDGMVLLPLRQPPLDGLKISLNYTYENEASSRELKPSGFCVIVNFAEIEEAQGRPSALQKAEQYADLLAQHLQLPDGGKFAKMTRNHFVAPGGGARVLVCDIAAAHAENDFSWTAQNSGAMRAAFDVAHGRAVAQMQRDEANVGAGNADARPRRRKWWPVAAGAAAAVVAAGVAVGVKNRPAPEGPPGEKDNIVRKADGAGAAPLQDLDREFGPGTQAKYGRYVDELREILPGVPVKVIATEFFGEQQLRLEIGIGDRTIADSTIDRLVKQRDAAGITKDDMPLGQSGGRFENISITLKGVEKSTNGNNGQSPFQRMGQAHKDAFRSAIAEARAEVAHFATLPSFAEQLSGDFSFKNKGIDNSHYEKEPLYLPMYEANFKLPENVRKAGLLYAQDVRAFLNEKGIDPRDTQEFYPLIKLVPKPAPLSDEALASYVLAVAMSPPYAQSQFSVGFEFNNKLDPPQFRGVSPDQRRAKGNYVSTDILLLVAQQIGYQTHGIKLGDVPNRPTFADRLSKGTPGVERLRC